MTPGAYEWRIANINGVDVSLHRASICSTITQVLCCGSTRKPNTELDRCWIVFRQLALPRVWVGEGHGDGEAVDR